MNDRHYLLFGVFILILIIISFEAWANQSEPNGHLHLSIYDTYGVGLYTSVIVRDTSGNKTEMSLEGLGEYSFSAIPGYYCLIIRMVGMQPMLTRSWLYLADVDTVKVYQEFERVWGSGDDWLVSDFMGKEFSGKDKLEFFFENLDYSDMTSYPVLSISSPDLRVL